MTTTPCWAPKNNRSPHTGHVIDYVLLAEFDIDTGSTLRHQYPNEIPGYKADWFAEHMLPEGAHNRINDYSYIFLNRNKAQVDESFWLSPLIQQAKNPEDFDPTNVFLYGLNIVHTKHDSSVRRGAIVKAMCIFSRYHFVDSFRKQLETALLRYFEKEITNKVEVLEELYNTLNSLDVNQLPRPNMMECILMRRGVHYDTIPSVITDYLPSSWNKECALTKNSSQEKNMVTIPIYRTPDEVGNISVQTLVKTFGDATMRIFHAIFTRQRVLFVGYNHAVSDIAMMVLSAVAMVAPPMVNVIKRTYPYGTLFDLTFTEVQGYIAGVTNPMFQQRDQWWDLLCVLDLPNGTGHVYSVEEKRAEDKGKSSTSSSSSANASASTKNGGNNNSDEAPYASIDNRFITAIQSGINARLGEDWIRQQFHDYTNKIIQLAQDKSTLLHTNKLNEKMKRIYDSNGPRFSSLETNADFKMLPMHPWLWCPGSIDNTSSNTDSASASASTTGVSNKRKKSITGTATVTTTATVTSNSSNTSVSSTTAAVEEENIYTKATLRPKPGAETNTDNSENNSEISKVVIVDGLLLKAYVRKLQYETNVEARTDIEEIYRQLELLLRSEGAMQGLLMLMPESQEGLQPLALGLFHKKAIVRSLVTSIMLRIQEYPSTRGAIATLNPMILGAFERQRKKALDGSLQQEIEEQAKADGISATAAINKSTTNNEVNDLSAALTASFAPLQSFLEQTMKMMDDDENDHDEDEDDDDDDENDVDENDEIAVSMIRSRPTSGTLQQFSSTIDELDLLP